ncbi:hypothetical protein CJA_3458 [Cellvibrio japonicus Ueda107]|uniref:Uncharacterized protein n=1 Tax=Cellvibrio japonicus (strain Ueda107) TaxID=498211 RepID=B3PG04_CELJU|nr:hypothetical protein CJA_3458 [Cellvibrio japonicus Ueda107]
MVGKNSCAKIATSVKTMANNNTELNRRAFMEKELLLSVAAERHRCLLYLEDFTTLINYP